jgi:hypothetical protein
MQIPRFLLIVVAAVIVSTVGTAVQAADSTQPVGWKAVLIAGDRAEPAFDNAVDAMRDKLLAFGVPQRDIVVLKASGDGAPVATRSNITAAFLSLDPGPLDGCFVYVTSHGGEGRGLFLSSERQFLTPVMLARLLGGACGDRPTVVIASGCFSGIYADLPLLGANRAILTAARADRPSFGCNAHLQYTIFDRCMLQSLARGLAWREVMDKTRACVSGNEFDLRISAPSQPQLAIGAAETNLLVFSR